jgi:hypothetical protein
VHADHSYFDKLLSRRCAVRALFRRSRQARHISYDDATGEVCDAACRSDAILDRARVHATTLLFR